MKADDKVYPQTIENLQTGESIHCRGISVRDEFAKAAMSGVYRLAVETVKVTGEPYHAYDNEIAEMCYNIADAMIAESEK